ncbi:hypothetical protein [Lentibacillus sp. CBA3610]|uniref:hypothetical protein n=1 Tax=Lentibacillus sp. CBA3610 TaxID=2518176 RepID=UPI001594E77E|nr:hypothetical protein [Lentibacillus sp. CBA3610]QKY70860.1 hypothetical protein Len3610_15870 [Lentibacillus sp. CBA3610]
MMIKTPQPSEIKEQSSIGIKLRKMPAMRLMAKHFQSNPSEYDKTLIARCNKKSKGQEAYPRFLVHDLIDVESGIILKTDASIASVQLKREISQHS